MKSQAITVAESRPVPRGPGSEAEVPVPFHLLPPWQQLRSLRETQHRLHLNGEIYPLVELRGERAYLRSLRAAELAAWETDPFPTDPAAFPPHQQAA